MQFFESSRFIFLWLIPIVFVILGWGSAERRKRLSRLGLEAFLEDRLMPGFLRSRRKLSALLLASVFLFSTFALARPQWGEERKKVERKGVDLIFLLDTSLSMLAEDIKPSRLAKSKLEIKNIIRRLKGDRVGMVAFAGSSFLQCPLTLDYSAFLLFVDALKPGYIPEPGTSLSHAIRLGIKAFPEESRKYRAIIVFSDGEDHEGGIEEALDEAKTAGARIYAVGVGTAEGEPIPLRSAENQKVAGYKKDRNGEVVITRLNPALLSQTARETGGLYLPASPAEKEIDLVLKHLETLGERQLKEQRVSQREDHFQLFLLLAFLFLWGETFLRNRKRRSPAVKIALPILAFFLLSGFLDTPRSLVQKGNRLAKEKKYQSAVENYRKAEVARPHEPVIRYDLGTSLYELYEYREAEKELDQALSQAKDPATRIKALYNYGNTQYRLGDFEKAIESYKKVLDLNPKDEDAKYNLEFLQKKKSQFEKKNQERQKQQQQNQPQPQPQQKKEQQQPQPKPQPEQQGQGQKNQPEPQPKEQQKEEQKESAGRGEEKEKKKGQSQQGEKEKQERQNEQQEKKQEQEAEQQRKQEPERKQQQQEPQEGDRQEAPLQGQMSQENALRILDTLQEEEKQFQDLRRPPVPSESREVSKDW